MTWWRNAVVYEVYVRSFADASGDGLGDLEGVRTRLPYLAALGVDAVWLTPFYRSPMADAGYDVADYRDVDPLFGTLADIDRLVAEAHERGLRVLVDIVPNHTSSEHAWFREALAAGPGSPARERYLFRTGRGADGALPPNDWSSVFGGSAWTRVPDGEWYLHLFDPGQPDLNWRNPEVHAEFLDVLRFWLDRGVDGFRIDVAMGLYKAEGLPDVGAPRQPNDAVTRSDDPIWGQPEVHDVYREWRRLLDGYPGDRLAIGEVWTDSVDDLVRYIRPDELHQAFGFDWLMAPWSAIAFSKVITDTLAVTGDGAAPTWVLANHDKVRTVTRYGGGRRGLARARAAVLAMLALPGSAYLYQGEELGLPEVTDIPEDALRDPVWERSGHTARGRDGCRVPIPWTDDAPGCGFSPGTARPWLPMPDGWGAYSVATELPDLDSTLRLYQEALRLRRDLADRPFAGPELSGEVLTFTRGDAFACVLNCGESAVPLPAHEEVLLSSGPLGDSRDGALPPDTAAWLRTA